MSVSLYTYISSLIIILFIMFGLLVFYKKPTKKETQQIREAGWEIIQEIEKATTDAVEKIQSERNKLEELLEKIEEKEGKTKEKIIDYKVIKNKKSSNNKEQIITLYKEGMSIEEISKELVLPKGVVEVSLNLVNAIKKV